MAEFYRIHGEDIRAGRRHAARVGDWFWVEVKEPIEILGLDPNAPPSFRHIQFVQFERLRGGFRPASATDRNIIAGWNARHRRTPEEEFGLPAPSDPPEGLIRLIGEIDFSRAESAEIVEMFNWRVIAREALEWRSAHADERIDQAITQNINALRDRFEREAIFGVSDQANNVEPSLEPGRALTIEDLQRSAQMLRREIPEPTAYVTHVTYGPETSVVLPLPVDGRAYDLVYNSSCNSVRVLRDGEELAVLAPGESRSFYPPPVFIPLFNRFYEPFPPRWKAADADAKSLDLLRAWLSPKQLEEFTGSNQFEVIGHVTGRRYRVRFPSFPYNVDLLSPRGDVEVQLCFVPKDETIDAPGDVMLMQKLALEFEEEDTLEIANGRARAAGAMPSPRQVRVRGDAIEIGPCAF